METKHRCCIFWCIRRMPVSKAFFIPFDTIKIIKEKSCAFKPKFRGTLNSFYY